MQTVTTIDALREAVEELRADGGTVALVPTMGALHDGHLTLIREAMKQADDVIASIYVNPRQFGEGEDLDAYPRPLAEDTAKLDREGVELLWAPDGAAMYPAGYATNISVSGVSGGLCGSDRPSHFDGVATVVCKLFNQVRPDMAFFGEKDWQQLAVIRRMARDLDLSFPRAEAILAVPTVREPDGLAMSSRNAYLSPEQRAAAATLPRAMEEAIARIRDGQEVHPTLGMLEDELLGAGFAQVDYAQLRDADTLERLDTDNGNSRLFVAARIGGTRLIDNMEV
ncbi:pantoate--beta-alanine ligase [Aurantiacibacter aquimixticola]|uniref:Pantothenate synthetase n=1 Tax=Aurantiacibacter aquimixticola TaxID=1958945 RepID=A0A419RV39_9SPHN|nr:pantoate--beta-alanine ligase [Aurantiacibacter aquimixticola]RJY09649.1 pantoate--beta-alanine ligase [Aurantiacibacter aquimixticola]